MLTHGSLFSGIGGFDLAAELAGFRNLFQVEIDEYCQIILKKNFPEVEKYSDVTKFKKENSNVTNLTVLSGGFPCQPFSVAGKQKGASDDRYLWPEMLRVIDEFTPKYIIAENVFNIKNMGLDSFISDLEDRNYSVRTFDISADSVRLPTMERHYWIIASPNSELSERSMLEAISRFSRLPQKLPRGYQKLPNRWSLSSSRVCGVGQGFSNFLDRASNRLETDDVNQYRLELLPELFTGKHSNVDLDFSLEFADYYEACKRHNEIKYLEYLISNKNELMKLYEDKQYDELLKQINNIEKNTPYPKKFRKKRTKALGNAIPPFVAYYLFHAIKIVETTGHKKEVN